MTKEKNIKLLNCKEEFKVVYVEEEHKQTDSTIVVYDTYKISILMSDGLGAVVNNKIINTEKNGILFFRPDEIHFGRFFRAGIHKYIDIHIPISFFNDFCDYNNFLHFLTDNSDKKINYILPDIYHKKILSDLCEKIIVMLNDNKNEIQLFSFLLNIILMCNDFYTIQKENPTNSNIPDIVKRTMEYIFENYDKKLSLEELSKLSKCSVTYLSRIFKKYTQMTIYQYIKNVRISNAKIMLKNGTTVTEACYYCGFDDCSNFINTFKKIVGTTPLKYKCEQTNFHKIYTENSTNIY